MLQDARVQLVPAGLSTVTVATDRLLRLTPRPTAIVYASDPMAVAGLGIIQGGVRWKIVSAFAPLAISGTI